MTLLWSLVPGTQRKWFPQAPFSLPLLPPPGLSLAPIAGSQPLTNSQRRENMEAWGNLGLVETRDHSVSPGGWFQNCYKQRHTHSFTETLYKYSAAGNRTAKGSPMEYHDQVQPSRANL